MYTPKTGERSKRKGHSDMADSKVTIKLEFEPALEEIQQEIDKTRQKISELKRELSEAQPPRGVFIRRFVAHFFPTRKSSPGILSEDYDRLVVFDMATNTELAVITRGDNPIDTASDDIVVKLRPVYD
jgi:hypothetical protein